MEIIKSERISESGWVWFKAKLEDVCLGVKKIANDDPRRLIHSLKVGFALTLVSLFYYFQPLYSSFGVSAMWAVMTVVVVFEFSVGATLGKGLNRGLATFVAGGLGLGAHHLAIISGKTCEPILIGIFVFVQAVASTFIRFIPQVKARYDYGMLIFILTFCLVSISGLKTDEIVELVHKRVSTIVIGASTCVLVSIFVYPVWAGEDLHNHVAKNIQKLAVFFQGFADECFRTSSHDNEDKARSVPLVVSLNSVLDSKTTLETLANFARWEPGHGRFLYRHPWKQYLKIANLTRQCACRVVALNGYLNSNTQAPEEIREIISRMSSECGKALKELASSVETMTKPASSYGESHEPNLKVASKNLHSLLESGFWEKHGNLIEVVAIAAVVSLLNDTVICVKEIADAIDELSTVARFKCKQDNIPCVIIAIDGAVSQDKLEPTVDVET